MSEVDAALLGRIELDAIDDASEAATVDAKKGASE